VLLLVLSWLSRFGQVQLATIRSSVHIPVATLESEHRGAVPALTGRIVIAKYPR